ncbi:MAG: TIGR04141 family sporadically distributed protein [Candidatus Pacebacteria bacterium]|nr:TIGR04141 family sporadically distributed protein [Candidatus Paceibacterota bacterium]
MIKPGYQRIEDIIDSTNEPRQIGEIGQFVFEESHPHPPAWITSFFGNALGEDLGIVTASAKGIFLVPVTYEGTTVNFVVSFGVGRFLLKEGIVEERFGLKVVLNSVDQESFRSIDKTTLGSVPKHSREQMSRDVTPAEFGIDIEQDLISSVTAKSRDPRLGKIITGKDALYLSVPVDKSNIIDFLEYCLQRYRSDDYRRDFDWIDQIAEVRNPTVEDALNSALVQKINQNNLSKVWMAVPEIINWADVSGFRYIRAKRSVLHNDLTVGDFLVDLQKQGQIRLEDLKDSDVIAINAANDEPLFRWSAFLCTYAEIDMDGKVYILNNGKWYEIARGFTQEIQRDFLSVADSNISLPNYTGGTELDYNNLAVSSLGTACCMDQKLITHGGGHSKIEFCDIFTGDRKLIHVKKYGGSSVLSHLFSQGSVSGELFVSDGEFRAKLNQELPRGYKLTNPRGSRPDARQYEVVYAIISNSQNPLEMPFFSKVSLRNARRRLTSYGYTVTKKKILKI